MKELFLDLSMKNLILIFIISLFIRLIYLGVVPVSLAHDEVDNIIQAYSVRFTGHDIAGSWLPWSLLPNSGVMAELGPIINLPAITLLPNSLFTSHLTTALLSSFYPIIVCLLLVSLGSPKFVAYSASLLLAISPWHIIFSRTALEQPTSLFFYTLSWLFLTRIYLPSKKKVSIYLNIIIFSLSYSAGFFSYHGYKFALPILTLMVLGYLFYQYRHALTWQKFVLPILIVLGLLLRTYIYSDYYSSRGKEIILFQTESFSKVVDNDRRLSLVPDSVDSIFSNKLTVLIDILSKKYLMTISPDILFTSGETNGVFSVGRIGYVYLVCLPFIAIGLVYLLYLHGPLESLILLLLLISPLASVIHINNTLAFRSGIYFVLLNIVISYGIYAVWKYLHSRMFIILISFILAIGFARFGYIYFSIHPVESATAYFFSDRLVGNYLSHNQGQNILVIDPQPRYVLSQWLLSKSYIGEEDIKKFDNHYSSNDLDIYHVGSIEIMRSCPLDTETSYDTIIVDRDILAGLNDCEPIQKLIFKSQITKINQRALVSPLDSGMEKLIIGDSICNDLELGRYIHPTSLTDFELSKLNRFEFCQKWVVEQ